MPANISQEAIDVVIESGFKGFLSAYGGWNWPGEDDFHLQRIHGDPGLASLTNWLTLDPRKLRRGSQLIYNKTAVGANVVLTRRSSAMYDRIRPLRTAFVITSMHVGGAETLLNNLIKKVDRSRIVPHLHLLERTRNSRRAAINRDTCLLEFN